MPIKYVDVPEKAINALETELGDFLKSRDFIDLFLGKHDVSNLSASEPHRVYGVSLEDILAKKPLTSAKFSAWRFILFDGAKAVTAVELDADLSFREVNSGRFVQATVDAIEKIADSDEFAKHEYELRLIKLPAVHAILIWLHAERDDFFVPISPGHPNLERFGIYDGPTVIEELHPVAQQISEDDDVAQE